MFRLTSTSRHRQDWTVEYQVGVDAKGFRAVGTLFNRGAVVRKFDVKMDEAGVFAPDIGTGSGVKVKFQHTAAQPQEIRP